MRPSFDKIYLNFAFDLSRRSTCKRLQVGCIIVSDDHTQIYAIGYNGNAHGLANTCDSEEPGNCGCIHAEENAVIHCGVPRTTPKIIYCTHLPCVACAKRIINLGGVEKIVYLFDYRKRDSIEILKKVNINVIKYRKELKNE